MEKKSKPAYPGSTMSAKEHRESMKEFNKRPGEAKKLKEIREKNKKMVYGNTITRGPNKGMVRGTGKG